MLEKTWPKMRGNKGKAMGFSWGFGFEHVNGVEMGLGSEKKFGCRACLEHRKAIFEFAPCPLTIVGSSDCIPCLSLSGRCRLSHVHTKLLVHLGDP